MSSKAAKALLPDFPNLVGHHCSSSAVRSVLAYDGLELSEAMVFGLGSGLGFFYSIEAEGSPTRRFNGRAPDLEGTFYALAGAPLDWAATWRPELFAESLAAGRPLLAQTDISPIPYYDDAHFIGHGLAVIGLQTGLQGDELVTVDIASEAYSRMPLKDFRAAVARPHYPLLAPYRYAQAPVLEAVDSDRMAPLAIARTARYMLEPPTPFEGVPGMGAMAEDFKHWVDLPDLPWAARFGYQAIEKRGTGGGNFRRLYRTFLQELEPVLGPGANIIGGFERSAGLWTHLAQDLKELAFTSERSRQNELLAGAAARTRAIAELEWELFEALNRVAA